MGEQRVVPERAWKPKFNPWIIAATVAIAAFMEVLDTSIANVALPHMISGNLGASSDEGTWVLTSYLVSNAIVLPLGAWASSVSGHLEEPPAEPTPSVSNTNKTAPSKNPQP